MPTQNELLELAEEIKKCMTCHLPYEEVTAERSVFIRDLFLEGPWFFPPKGSVKGFWGTGPVMFVAERPSPPAPMSTTEPSNFSRKTFAFGLLESFTRLFMRNLLKTAFTT
jgi:hypothetical protein